MQKRHYEKKCEDMAYRLRETEKSLQALQKEVASYRVNTTHVLSPSLTNLHLKNEKACNCDNLHKLFLLFFPICSSFYFRLTFLDHLLVQGRALFQSSSIYDLVPWLQSVGISSCLPLRYPSVYFSVDHCFLSLKLNSLAISHRCGCVLASSSGQTTIVFCFPGKFHQVFCAHPS